MMGEPRWLEPDNFRSMNTQRAIGVIKLAAEKGGWGRAMPSGHGLGIAFISAMPPMWLNWRKLA